MIALSQTRRKEKNQAHSFSLPCCLPLGCISCIQAHSRTHSYPAAFAAELGIIGLRWQCWSRGNSLKPLFSIWCSVHTQIGRNSYGGLAGELGVLAIPQGAQRRLLACLTMMSPLYWFIGRGLGGDYICVRVSVLKSPRGFFFFFKRAQLVPVTAYQGEWDRKWSQELSSTLEKAVEGFRHGEIQSACFPILCWRSPNV